MHLQSTYEPPLLLKFNSTTLQTWAGDALEKWYTIIPSFPLPVVLTHTGQFSSGDYICRGHWGCARWLRRVSEGQHQGIVSETHRPINSERRMTSVLASFLLPPVFVIMHKPEEKGDSYPMICGTEVTYHHTCCCIAKLYIQLVLSTRYQDGTSANREHINVFKLGGITPKGHQVTHTLQQLHACFHRAH